MSSMWHKLAKGDFCNNLDIMLLDYVWSITRGDELENVLQNACYWVVITKIKLACHVNCVQQKSAAHSKLLDYDFGKDEKDANEEATNF